LYVDILAKSIGANRKQSLIMIYKIIGKEGKKTVAGKK
jgi:hypothetical protein